MNATSWRLSARPVLPVRSSGLRLPRIDDLDTGGIECAGIGRREDQTLHRLGHDIGVEDDHSKLIGLAGAPVERQDRRSLHDRVFLDRNPLDIVVLRAAFLKGTAASQGKNGQIEFSAPAIQHLKATQGEANRAAPQRSPVLDGTAVPDRQKARDGALKPQEVPVMSHSSLRKPSRREASRYASIAGRHSRRHPVSRAATTSEILSLPAQ